MKIVFLGNFSVPYCSEVHYQKTFDKLGIEVVAVQEPKVNGLEIIKLLEDGADMFFWVHTHGWLTSNIDKVLEYCKEHRIPSVGYHLDLWMGIERQKDLESDPYWGIDYFFCTDKLMVDHLNRRDDMPKAFYLPAGVFEDECYLGERRKEYEHDVIFVGSKGYHHEWPYRPKLINWLQDTYGDRFAHYGGDGKGVVRGKDLNDLYASAKVVVGDTLCKDFCYPFYSSDRYWESIGRGAFLIYPYIRGLQNYFTDKKELVYYTFNNFLQLKSLIDYYIELIMPFFVLFLPFELRLFCLLYSILAFQALQVPSIDL